MYNLKERCGVDIGLIAYSNNQVHLKGTSVGIKDLMSSISSQFVEAILQQPAGVLLGFDVMRTGESVNIPFTIIKTRFDVG